MKKNEIIKKNYEFTKIINEGKRLRNNYYTIFFKKSNNNHYGISIPTKTGNAVTRNKIKRQVKNIIDNNKNAIQINNDYVIIIKKRILELNYNQMEKNLIELIRKR